MHQYLARLIVVNKMSVEGTLSKPVDDCAIEATADHIHYLFMDLCGSVGGVADNHVVAKSEPGQEIGVHPGAGAGV